MRLTDIYKKNKDFPIVITILTFICILISVTTFFYPPLYDLFCFSTNPKYPWQYLTGIFEHGIEPRWFLWIHLGMNLLGLIPFGILVEKWIGSKKTLVIILTEWIITAVLFQVLAGGTDRSMAGISSIEYALAVMAFFYFFQVFQVEKKKIWKQPFTYFFVFEGFGMLSMLPQMAGDVVSLGLHGSGLVIGIMFGFLYKN